jgi:hypothetical protein
MSEPTTPFRFWMMAGLVLVAAVIVGCSTTAEIPAKDTVLLYPDWGKAGPCIGVEPDESAWSQTPGPITVADTTDAVDAESDAEADAESDAKTDEDTSSDAAPGRLPGAGEEDTVEPPDDPTQCENSPGTCIGEPSPTFALKDFQPLSCGFDAVYGLDNFKGHVTVAVLLAAW